MLTLFYFHKGGSNLQKKLLKTIKKGIIVGFTMTWDLAKIIFPVTFIITILKNTPVMGYFAKVLEPFMSILGLTGESAIVLVLGNILNLYAAIGAILTMELSVKQVFILAVMLSLSHNLIVETAITTRIGVNPWFIALLRISTSFIFAIGINLLWTGGQQVAQYGFIPQQEQALLTNWPEILINALQVSFIGIIQIALIVIPIMIVIQVLKDFNFLPMVSKVLSPFTKLIGVSEKTGVTLLAGIFFGIAYGAGVIIQTAKEEKLSKKDIYLVSIFLVSCHAVIEDTLIFLPLGINVLPLLIIRIVLALIITVLTASFWRKVDNKRALSDIP